MLAGLLPLAVSIDEVLQELGYAGLALLMFTENVFPPIPSEAILPLAGYLVGRGELSFPIVIFAATLGSVGGSMFLYELARRGGRPFAFRFMRFARMDPGRLDQAEEWFRRRGPIAVLAGRCVPGVRSLVSLPAGVLRMPRMQYFILTTVGTVVWNVALASAGWVLGNEWEQVSEVVGSASTPVLIVVLVVLSVVLVRASMRRRTRRTG